LFNSVYHPQTDGLIERFNQTLKQMLKKVMEVDGRNWDHLLLYLMFLIHEGPQALTGFSPFELLYERFVGCSERSLGTATVSSSDHGEGVQQRGTTTRLPAQRQSVGAGPHI